MRRRRRRDFRVPIIVFPIIALALLVVAAVTFIHFKKIDADPVTITPPKAVSIFVRKSRLAEQLFTAHPTLIRLTITPHYLNSTLELKGEEEKPVAQLCGSSCYLLGEHGYVYAGTSSQPLLPIVSRLRIEPNSTLKPALARAFAATFELTTLNRIGLRRVEILTNEDLRFVTAAGWYFLLDPKQSPERQLRKLTFFLQRKSSDVPKLRYIDLRIPQKIYFQ